jgi:hypothetical protein
MEKINVQFTKDFAPTSGIVSSVGWQQLQIQSIEEAVKLKKNERITGLVVSFLGVNVHIEKD